MFQLFTTQVYKSKIGFELKELSKEIQQILQADIKGHQWSEKNYVNGYTSYGSWDQLHKMSSTFESLQKKIDRHVYKYCEMLNYQVKSNDIAMTTCWVNFMPPGSLHTAHIHPQSIISGTFYVETPPGTSQIKFEDPRLGFFMNSPDLKPKTKATEQRFFSIKPSPGDVVLFESWLKHEVPMNCAKKPRVSVSFNYGWC